MKTTNEQLKIKHHTKWCFICGRRVDLRKVGAYELADDYKPNNKEYGFICSKKCKEEFRSRIIR